MPDQKTRADALRLYHSGAASVDDAQTDQESSLGGNRSSTEVEVLGVTVTNAISNVTIDFVSGENGTGDGTLEATGVDELTYTPPGGSAGAAVTIANGETKIIEGDDPSKFVRVTRTSTANLSGTATLALADVLNNVIGFSNVSSADAGTGITQYRAVFLQNEHASVQAENVKVRIATLGTQQVSDNVQLGASGSGTIETSGSYSDWPDSGWCHIKDGGTTREVVYYSSRTDTVLTVPSTGRGLLGTSAAAGGAADTLDAVPGVRVAIEAPSSGAIQTIADDETAPTGVTWSLAITDASALSIGTLAVGADYGVWIEYEIPQDAQAAALVLNVLRTLFDAA